MYNQFKGLHATTVKDDKEKEVNSKSGNEIKKGNCFSIAHVYCYGVATEKFLTLNVCHIKLYTVVICYTFDTHLLTVHYAFMLYCGLCKT